MFPQASERAELTLRTHSNTSRKSWDRSKCQVDIQPEPRRCWSHSCYRNLSFSSGLWCRNRPQLLYVFITGNKTEKPALIAFASVVRHRRRSPDFFVRLEKTREGLTANHRYQTDLRWRSGERSSIQRPPHLFRRCRKMPQIKKMPHASSSFPRGRG